MVRFVARDTHAGAVDTVVILHEQYLNFIFSSLVRTVEFSFISANNLDFFADYREKTDSFTPG